MISMLFFLLFLMYLIDDYDLLINFNVIMISMFFFCIIYLYDCVCVYGKLQFCP